MPCEKRNLATYAITPAAGLSSNCESSVPATAVTTRYNSIALTSASGRCPSAAWSVINAAAGSTMSVSVMVATPVMSPESAMQVAVTSGASTLAYSAASGPATQNAVTTMFQTRNAFGSDFAL